MLVPRDRIEPCAEVLFAHGYGRSLPRWLLEVDAVLRPSGLEVSWAGAGSETIRRIEGGGLIAAVLVADQNFDGLSLLRIIRSIDVGLPCWLATCAPTRATLQTALDLRATGVVTLPLDADMLSLAIRKLVTN